MVKRHRHGLVVLALGALCVGILGAGTLSRSRGVPGQIEFLFQAVVGLSEKSQDHDEKIELIVAHIDALEASLCEFYGEGPRPSFCGSPCIEGSCDTWNVDPCVVNPDLPACNASEPVEPGQ